MWSILQSAKKKKKKKRKKEKLLKEEKAVWFHPDTQAFLLEFQWDF